MVGLNCLLNLYYIFFMFAVALFILFGIGLITWVMTKSADYLMDDEIDVDENDFLTSAGRDGWDDNSVHSEGDF